MTTDKLPTRLWRSVTTQPLLTTVLGGVLVLLLERGANQLLRSPALVLEIRSTTAVASSAGAPSALSLRFADKPVTGVVKTTMALVNQGSSPVHTGTGDLSPTVFIDSGRFLSAEVTGTKPATLSAALVLDSSGTRFAYVTTLLNPKDEITATIYTEGEGVPQMKGGIHLDGISQLPVIDRTVAAGSRAEGWSVADLVAFVVGEVYFLLALGVTLVEIGYERARRKAWTGALYGMLCPTTPFSFVSVLEVIFRGNQPLVDHIQSQLSSLDPTKEFPPPVLQALREQVTNYADRLRHALLRNMYLNLTMLFVVAIYFIWSSR